MADVVYNIAKRDLLKADVDFDSATIHGLLTKSPFAVDVDDDTVADALSGGGELSGSGYARETLENVAVTLDDGNDRAYVDADDPAFGSIASGETITGGLYFKFVTNDAGSTPLVWQDYTDTPTNGQAVTVQFAATGFLMLT